VWFRLQLHDDFHNLSLGLSARLDLVPVGQMLIDDPLQASTPNQFRRQILRLETINCAKHASAHMIRIHRETLMSEITLHFAPHTCARVAMIALEEAAYPYQTEIVAFMRGDHRAPRYLALNPKGKVPALIVDGQVLTENVAILTWLADRFPDAGLLPALVEPFARAQVVADLSFCASGLHPIVTRLRIPQYFCDTLEGVPRTFAMAEEAMRPNFQIIEERLSRNAWWYGERWSIMDAYINWVWFRVAGTAFDVSAYPHFSRHDERIRLRPAVQRALRRGEEADEWLKRQGLEVKFSGAGAVTAGKVYLTPCSAVTSSRIAAASDKRCSLAILPSSAS